MELNFNIKNIQDSHNFNNKTLLTLKLCNYLRNSIRVRLCRFINCISPMLINVHQLKEQSLIYTSFAVFAYACYHYSSFTVFAYACYHCTSLQCKVKTKIMLCAWECTLNMNKSIVFSLRTDHMLSCVFVRTAKPEGAQTPHKETKTGKHSSKQVALATPENCFVYSSPKRRSWMVAWRIIQRMDWLPWMRISLVPFKVHVLYFNIN